MKKQISTRLFIINFFIYFFNIVVAQESSLRKLLSVPYIDQIKGASKVDRIVFSANEAGKRNLYIAYGDNYQLTKITTFDTDDAQELTSISISSDGKWVIFVRGGDHGANSAPVATNSGSHLEKTTIEIFTYSIENKKLYKIGLGDFPTFHPSEKYITYVRSGQLWVSDLDKENSGRQLFSTKGSIGEPQWSPDGTQLAFTVRRGDYSFIGIYQQGAKSINWISPSFHTDSSPRWSPDSKELAFVRRSASGGEIDSITSFPYQAWAIHVMNLAQSKETQIYKAPFIKQSTYPRISKQINLHWKSPNHLTFVSYESGWPHLYRIDKSNKVVKQLTYGDYTVDNVNYSADGNFIVFAANTGKLIDDFDRSHIGKVEIKTGKLEILTYGEGIETQPIVFANNKKIVLASSTYNRPVQPQVLSLETKQSTLLASDLMIHKNDQFVKPTQVWIQAEDGVKFSAQYYKPKNHKKNLPALIYIHGGPRRQMYLGWHHIDYYFYDYAFNQHLVNEGYAVLVVNYRMGTGYGFDFQHPPSAGNLGASEYKDILASGKWLQNDPDINKNKIGVFGGSYGGYLTAMALGKNSDIFKAGVDIHGVHNRARKQNPDYYAPDFDLATKLNWDSSPSRYVDSWKSPVLIIHGDDDQNVPFQQSIDLYNRLINRGVKVEALVLPDENHHWQLFENLLKVKSKTLDFFNKNLK